MERKGNKIFRRPKRLWSETNIMAFGDDRLDVADLVKTRDQHQVRSFVREHTDLADSTSFSRIISFDTECSVNYADHCEMCSFGYAEFDLEGNKLAEEEIYIKAKPAKGRLKEKCQADPEKYVNAPLWREQYPKIRDILTRKDTVYIAHSCKSDIGFLMQMNRERNTDQFYFRVFDTLEMFQMALPNFGKYNLPFLADALGIEHDSHVSLSDAIVCFQVLQEVAEMNNLSVKQMFENYQEQTLFDSMDVLRDNFRTELRHQIEDIKSRPQNFVKGPLNGLKFAATKKMEKADPEAMLAFARYVIANGGQYVPSMAVANIFVWDGDKESGEYSFATSRRKSGLKILRVDQILDGRYGKFPEVCENLIVRRE